MSKDMVLPPKLYQAEIRCLKSGPFSTIPSFLHCTGTCSTNTRVRVFTAEITKGELVVTLIAKLLVQDSATK